MYCAHFSKAVERGFSDLMTLFENAGKIIKGIEHFPDWRVLLMWLLVVLGTLICIACVYCLCTELPQQRTQKPWKGFLGIIIGLFLIVMNINFLFNNECDRMNKLQLQESQALNTPGMEKDASKPSESVKRGIKGLARIFSIPGRGVKAENELNEVNKLALEWDQLNSTARETRVKNLDANKIDEGGYKALREKADALPDNSPVRIAIDAKLKDVPQSVANSYAAFNPGSKPTINDELRDRGNALFDKILDDSQSEKIKGAAPPPTSGETGVGGRANTAEKTTSRFSPTGAQRVSIAGEGASPLASITLGGKSYDISSAQDLRKALRELDPNTATEAEIASIEKAMSKIYSRNHTEGFRLYPLLDDIKEVVGRKIPDAERAGDYAHFLQDGRTRTSSGRNDFTYNDLRGRLNQYLEELAPSDYTPASLVSDQQADLAQLDNLLVSEKLFRKILHPKSPELQRDVDAEIAGLVQKAITQKIDNLQKQIDAAPTMPGVDATKAEKVKELQEYQKTLREMLPEFSPAEAGGAGVTPELTGFEPLFGFDGLDATWGKAVMPETNPLKGNPFAGFAPATKKLFGKAKENTFGRIKNRRAARSGRLESLMDDLRDHEIYAKYDDITRLRGEIEKGAYGSGSEAVAREALQKRVLELRDLIKQRNESLDDLRKAYPEFKSLIREMPLIGENPGLKDFHIENGVLTASVNPEYAILHNDNPNIKSLGNWRYGITTEAPKQYTSELTQDNPLSVWDKIKWSPENAKSRELLEPYIQSQVSKLNELEQQKAVYTALGLDAAEIDKSIKEITDPGNISKSAKEFADLMDRIRDTETNMFLPTQFRRSWLPQYVKDPYGNRSLTRTSFVTPFNPESAEDAALAQKYLITPEVQRQVFGGIFGDAKADVSPFILPDFVNPSGEGIRPGMEATYKLPVGRIHSKGKSGLVYRPDVDTDPALELFAGNKSVVPRSRFGEYFGRKPIEADLPEMRRLVLQFLYNKPVEEFKTKGGHTYFGFGEDKPLSGKDTLTFMKEDPAGMGAREWKLRAWSTPRFLWNVAKEYPGRTTAAVVTPIWLGSNAFPEGFNTAAYQVGRGAGNLVGATVGRSEGEPGTFIPSDKPALVSSVAKGFGKGVSGARSTVDKGLSSGGESGENKEEEKKNELPPPAAGSIFDVPSKKFHEALTEWAPDLAEQPYAHAVGGAGLGAAIGTGLGALAHFLPDSTLSEEERKRKSLLRSMLSGAFAGMTAGGVIGGIDDIRRA